MSLYFSLFLVSVFAIQGIHLVHPDTYLSTVELIHKYGYPVEIHEVTTDDGYILTMYRIPYGKMDSTANRMPILLMHGLMGQAENFIVNGINNASLAYHLADNGYDVWIGNTRGSQHGTKHTFLDPRYKEFWNFSFHEIGVYDVPAKIDYILKTTKKNKLHYVGHSQGGTVFYIMATLKPEYQKKIALASLMAPGGYEKHFTHFLFLPLARMHKLLTKFAEETNIFELLPAGLKLSDIMFNLCPMVGRLCIMTFYYLYSEDPKEINEQMVPLVFRFISNCSVKQLLHYSQIISSGQFRPWDYGTEVNMKIYGRPLPLNYAVENITVPTAMYYSLGDTLAVAKDIEDICDAMQNCKRKFLIRNKKWSHFDFVASKNSAKQLIEPLIKFAKKYDSI